MKKLKLWHWILIIAGVLFVLKGAHLDTLAMEDLAACKNTGGNLINVKGGFAFKCECPSGEIFQLGAGCIDDPNAEEDFIKTTLRYLLIGIALLAIPFALIFMATKKRRL